MMDSIYGAILVDKLTPDMLQAMIDYRMACVKWGCITTITIVLGLILLAIVVKIRN